MLIRRTFLQGLFAAPAIVVVGSIMPVRVQDEVPVKLMWEHFTRVEKNRWVTLIRPGWIHPSMSFSRIEPAGYSAWDKIPLAPRLIFS